MARGLFGGRKGSTRLEEAAGDWPSLADAAKREAAAGLDLPALAYVLSTAAPAGADTAAATAVPARAETELLEQIAAFRSAVADRLFERSSDYQILCNLTHENLAGCDDTLEELRRRLTGNIHYTVLAKLDEAHALVAAHIGGRGRAPDTD